jgi:3-deoxy-D-manno-octulosonic acid kinase
VQERSINGLNFKLIESCTDRDLELISAVIRSKDEDLSDTDHKADSLSGRGVIHFVNLPAFGSVAVKQYRRGGLVSLLIKERYLAQSINRPERELAILQEAQQLGVNVPRPLGYATEGNVFYKAWLLTEEIPSHKSLSELAQTDPEVIPELVARLVSQVSLLIAARIHHIDLHPGNTVVSGDGQVYILDFDKAAKVDFEPKELRDKYLVRWRRAVIKHNLPEILSEAFCLGLRRSAILDS